MSSEPITYFNRYTGKIEEEQIYGERALRFAYQTPPGRVALSWAVKRAWFSRWYGQRMDRWKTSLLINPFIEKYKLDPEEFALPPSKYHTFNEFFYRKLKPEARPIDSDPASVVFPADGRHLGFQRISEVEAVFVKGQRFNLSALLGSGELAERYADGTLVLSRLCPVDYHRFHFSTGGTPVSPKLINGPLYSVSPIALKRNLSYLWQNKRVLTVIRTTQLGEVIQMEIGATNVGSIVQTAVPYQPVTKGAEKGYFRFGGSSTITLFEPGKVTLASDLLEQTAQQRELYAHVGDKMGAAV
ncbi:MAG: phosphatidylserine decarboxylase [Verrucomicrobiaceae bacterium]|nr:MAG: phosphatidylserine decarboxylase [Verrucomicrobiaceae bacterium]